MSAAITQIAWTRSCAVAGREAKKQATTARTGTSAIRSLVFTL